MSESLKITEISVQPGYPEECQARKAVIGGILEDIADAKSPEERIPVSEGKEVECRQALDGMVIIVHYAAQKETTWYRYPHEGAITVTKAAKGEIGAPREISDDAAGLDDLISLHRTAMQYWDTINDGVVEATW